MKEFWNKPKFTKTEISLVIGLAFLLIGYWWFSTHVWFRIEDDKISINQQSKPYDYSCFKSLNGEIYCHHQDNGTQYLIVPKTNEIYTIDGERIIYLEGLVISSTFTNTLHNSKIREKLPDKITRGENFIEFAPTISESRRFRLEQHWRIYD
jgi:hypothetical protein